MKKKEMNFGTRNDLPGVNGAIKFVRRGASVSLERLRWLMDTCVGLCIIVVEISKF